MTLVIIVSTCCISGIPGWFFLAKGVTLVLKINVWVNVPPHGMNRRTL